MQECCKKCIAKLLDSLATVTRLVKKLSEIYDAVHGMGQPTYIIDKHYLTTISGPSNSSTYGGLFLLCFTAETTVLYHKKKQHKFHPPTTPKQLLQCFEHSYLVDGPLNTQTSYFMYIYVANCMLYVVWIYYPGWLMGWLVGWMGG